MSRFYLTLPSNSSRRYYPENTVARYTTKLDNTVELHGDWEVGLVEISTPADMTNVGENECYLDIRIDDRPFHMLVLPSGHYRRLRNLLMTIHTQQRKQLQLIGQTEFERRLNLLANFIMDGDSVLMRLRNAVYGNISIRFSKTLARILGFDADVYYSGDSLRALRVPDLKPPATVRSMYVYCDLLEHVVVGDTKAPLLRIVNKPHTTVGNVHDILNPILYVPLQKKSFDTVEIDIMTDTGSPVPFVDGKSFVVLELRRAIHPYFAAAL